MCGGCGQELSGSLDICKHWIKQTHFCLKEKIMEKMEDGSQVRQRLPITIQ